MDLEGPPTNFTYVNESKPAPDDPVIGCECENCLDVSNMFLSTQSLITTKRSTCNSRFHSWWNLTKQSDDTSKGAFLHNEIQPVISA